MPRRPRIFIDGGMYHVYNRLTRGGRDFEESDQAHAFVTEMTKVKFRDSLIVYAWCLLPMHYHLLVRTSTRPLWRSMATVGLAMTRQINRKAKVKGPGWQSRYKDRHVTVARRALTLVACDRYTLPVKSVADHLGKRPDVVSCWLRSAATERHSSQNLAELVNRVDEWLRASRAENPRET